jgi:hypothetical protein
MEIRNLIGSKYAATQPVKNTRYLTNTFIYIKFAAKIIKNARIISIL